MINSFYRIIDERCQQMELTHKELAKMVGITEVTMSRYLHVNRVMSAFTWMKMCKVLNLDPDELIQVYYIAVNQEVKQ